MDAESMVREWFCKYGGAGMILPSGWFGVPFDNLHQLTFVATRPHNLLVELDEQILLILTGLRTVKTVSLHSHRIDLVLSGFAELVLHRLAFGSLEPSTETFDQGELRFVARIATNAS